MILNNFPLLPDEHIYSWIVRQYWLSGYPSFKRFCLSSGTDISVLKTQDIFTRSFIDVVKLASINHRLETILENHSHLRLWEVSLSDSINIYELEKTFSKYVHMNERLMFHFKTCWLSCPVCRDVDFSRYGTSFWHLSHQIPSVIYCKHHHVELETAATTINNLAVGRLPHQVEEWDGCSDVNCPTVYEWSEFLFHMAQRCSSSPFYRGKLRETILDHLGILSMNGASQKRYCKEVYPEFEERVGKNLLKHLFRTHSKPGQRGKLNVLSALLLTLDQWNGIRNPIYWFLMAYWLRDEIVVDEC